MANHWGPFEKTSFGPIPASLPDEGKPIVPHIHGRASCCALAMDLAAERAKIAELQAEIARLKLEAK